MALPDMAPPLPDLQVILDRLGLSQVGAARLMGRNERTVRRWFERGPPPDLVPLLLAVERIASLTGRAPAEIITELRSA